ncbi:hypothetical protein BRADI_1g24850v3 [Brachypodium distachyon]|uniref:MSP domain-containing protein n=1 Tax=Brachypodium distachyon TaxID=15368 RepID=I1GTI0_BRADI|nr:hypothetical protein BRADI_1g24850v3 [Brachypodium distachyon]
MHSLVVDFGDEWEKLPSEFLDLAAGDEPGKQVKSAIRIKNTSKSHVAFKFQTTAPKSCFMRPPGAILAPGETVIATVFKFVEHPENNENVLQKCKVKFKILSLKVKEPMDYAPELFDEQKDQAVVEKLLRVIFLDVQNPGPQLEKLNTQLAEAEAALEARKKPPEESGPRIVGEGLVIDEWKERRERYLAQQQVEVVDSV